LPASIIFAGKYISCRKGYDETNGGRSLTKTVFDGEGNGRMGGRARAQGLSKKRREEIASEAAKARWAEKEGKK